MAIFDNTVTEIIHELDSDAVVYQASPVLDEIVNSLDSEVPSAQSFRTLTEIINEVDYIYYGKNGIIGEGVSFLEASVYDFFKSVEVTQSISVIGSVISDIVNSIIESAILNGTLSSSGVFIEEAEDSIKVASLIRLKFLLEILDNVDAISSLSSEKILSLRLEDRVDILLSYIDNIIGHNAVGDSIDVLDSNVNPIATLISEILNVQSDALPLMVSDLLLVEGIDISPTLISEILLSITIEDILSASGELSTSAILNNKLQEYLTFTLELPGSDSSYYGWTYNPENKATTNYDLNFSELTSYKDNFYLANGSGLYMFGGSLDEGSYIKSKITTAGLTFGKRTEKQIPQVFLGIGGTNHIVTVTVDERNTAYYELKDRSDDGLATKTLKIGKGLIGNTWQLSLSDVNQLDFDLDSLEFFPVFLKRKHR